MTFTLAPELEQFVRDQVASGKYDSADELISAALRLLMERHEPDQQRIEALRREIRVGVEQLDRGDAVDYDDQSLKELFETIKRDGRERLARAAEEDAA